MGGRVSRLDNPWTSDAELVTRILEGSQEHFELLYTTYFPRVFRFAMKRLGDRREAEDVTQEVFFTVFNGIDRFEGKSSLLVWIFGITRNTVNRRFRKSRPRLESLDGTPHLGPYRDPSPTRELLRAAGTGLLARLFGEHQGPLLDVEPQPDWVCFACALIRRDVLAQVGLLDPGFYLYFDDPDYCRRAAARGWRIANCPEARVTHLGGCSNPVESLAAARKRRPRYYYASRSRYFAKFYGRSGLWLTNLMWLVGRGVSLARELAGNKAPHLCEKEWLDIWTNGWRPVAPAVEPPDSKGAIEDVDGQHRPRHCNSCSQPPDSGR